MDGSFRVMCCCWSVVRFNLRLAPIDDDDPLPRDDDDDEEEDDADDDVELRWPAVR